GINAPDVLWEIKTYSAHLYHQAIVQQDSPWGNYLLSQTPNPNGVLPAHAFLQEARRSPGRHGWRAHHTDNTLIFALIAWHHIQKSASGNIDESWNHRQIKYLIQPKQKTPVAPPTLVQMPRSEEHTSELQSPDHLVCRLLLEKKNQNQRAKTSRMHDLDHA